MREILLMRLTQRNTLWSQLEQIYFLLNIKITNKTGLQLCEAISLQTMCVKFCLNVGKLLFCGCQECLDCIQNLELK